MQDLHSQPRAQTHAPAVRATSPNDWTARDFPESLLLNYAKLFILISSSKKGYFVFIVEDSLLGSLREAAIKEGFLQGSFHCLQNMAQK